MKTGMKQNIEIPAKTAAKNIAKTILTFLFILKTCSHRLENAGDKIFSCPRHPPF
jgi:hypothetical protein